VAQSNIIHPWIRFLRFILSEMASDIFTPSFLYNLREQGFQSKFLFLFYSIGGHGRISSAWIQAATQSGIDGRDPFMPSSVNTSSVGTIP
jgi:hypothetical protein